MLSSVLRSQRSVELNILIIRAFVRLREYLATNQEFAHKPDGVERTQREHGAPIEQIYDYIQRLMAPEPSPNRPRIGFT
jgi:hypothetical protein